jgi:hypothetical protein
MDFPRRSIKYSCSSKRRKEEEDVACSAGRRLEGFTYTKKNHTIL